MKSAEKDLIPTPGEIWKILREYADSQGLFVFRVEGNDHAVLVNKPKFKFKFKPKVFC